MNTLIAFLLSAWVIQGAAFAAGALLFTWCIRNRSLFVPSNLREALATVACVALSAYLLTL